MPKSIAWNGDQDAKLRHLIDYQGVTIRSAAERLGVSRSFAQRRAKLLSTQSHRRICSAAREAAGVDPLPVGHAITWDALWREHVPFRMSDY